MSVGYDISTVVYVLHKSNTHLLLGMVIKISASEPLIMIFRSICVINLSNINLENVMFSDFDPLTKLSKLTIKNKISHSIQYFLVIYIFCIFNLFFTNC